MSGGEKPLIVEVVARVKVTQQRLLADQSNNFDITFRSTNPQVMLGSMIDPTHEVILRFEEVIPQKDMPRQYERIQEDA
jgi:hypothetical protein